MWDLVGRNNMDLEDAERILGVFETRRKKLFPPSNREEELEIEILDYDIKSLKNIMGRLMSKEGR